MRWAAEWQPQRALLLTWPRADGDFATDFDAVQRCFVDIAAATLPRQQLIISAASDALAAEIDARIAGDARPHIHVVPSDDVWVRDHGPISVCRDEGVTLVDFRFDGWGGKYPARRDDALCARLGELGAFGTTPLVRSELVLEGGAIEGNGAGTLMATRSSVLDPKRNPGWSQDAIENELRRQLGICHFHWLDHGELVGDDTDGHIDTLARFVARDHIVYQGPGGDSDPNRAALEAMEAELRALRDPDGEPYRLSALPPVPLVLDIDGAPLPASYANFCFINGAVLMPSYRSAHDERAVAVLRACCPGREVVAIDCLPLVQQYGSLHCVTQNWMDD